MQFSLKYGKELVSAEIPDKNLMLYAVPPGRITPLANEDIEIRRAFAEPIGTKTLSDLASTLQPEDRVIILTSDYTRPTPTAKLVRYVLEELEKGGVLPDRVDVIFCAGLHRCMSEREMRDLLGESADKVAYSCHDAFNSECVPIYVSKNGTPIEINKRVVDAKLRISLSTVEPHHAAGWSGGGKNVLPGVSSAKTIYAHHSQMLDERVRIGALTGNPFREDIDDVAKTVPIDFICNVILTEKKEIAMICCGDVVLAHRELARRGNELVTVPLPDLADVVIASPGGAPRDDNFWQTEGKCLTRIAKSVKPGGQIIVVSKCTEGVGQESLASFMNEKMIVGSDFQKVFEEIRGLPFTVQRNKIARMSKIFLRNKVAFVCSETMRQSLKNSPIEFFDDLQSALDQALVDYGPDTQVLIVPETTRVILQPPNP